MKYFVIVSLIVISFLGSMTVSSIIFNCTIDNTYNQYNLVTDGKLNKVVDCLGDTHISIGQYDIEDDIRIYAKGHQSGGLRTVLKGGDCEYILYKGWYWGVWDFYYIAPK